MSCHFYNSNYSDNDNKKTTNNIIEVINGKYVRGQMNKGVLDSMSNGFIQSIYNDFGYIACSNFIDDLQNIVTEYMKQSAYSVGISDLIANRVTNDKIKRMTNMKIEDYVSGRLIFYGNYAKINRILYKSFQLVIVILLALTPVFAAIEAYSSYFKKNGGDICCPHFYVYFYFVKSASNAFCFFLFCNINYFFCL